MILIHHPGKWGRVAIINHIKAQLKSHPSCCKDSGDDKGVRYITNLSDHVDFVCESLLQTAPHSEFRSVKRAATHRGRRRLTRRLIGHFHRQLRFNPFSQGEPALKEVQPFSISTLIPHREAETGCLVKFTYVDRLALPRD